VSDVIREIVLRSKSQSGMCTIDVHLFTS